MNIKLSTKLYWGFFVTPAVILLGISLYSMISFGRINQQVTALYDDRIVPLQQLKLVSDAYAVLVVDAVNKAHEGVTSTETALESLEQASLEIEDHWQAYKQTNLTPEEEELAREVEALFVPVNQTISRLKQVLETGDISVLDAYDGPMYEVIDPLTQKIQELINLQLDIAAQKRADVQNVYSRIILFFGLIIFVAVVVASPMGYIFSQSITKTLKKTVEVVSESSIEIATATEQQERTANQQASAVNETTTTMNELSTSSKSTAEQAESAVMDAKQALNLTENGSQAVEKTLERMANLREKVDAIAQQIIRLSEQTNQIGNISKLVSDLANQTNMLALNAAVEAVRAGEHGKGFAVVASEIRKLSDESQKSAQRINTLVSDIQNAINSTVIVTEEGTKTVLSGVEIAQVTAEALMGVSDAVNNVVLNNQQISLNTQQQAIAISQVLEAMNSINQGANETANGLNQTKTGLQKLNQVALELQSSI
ncbi:methyl-accepting chemotaxis protein [Capilliphycus salinus ALCB114379]|uniref:HAMP domain-containing methyl-accepting chemotaxis protein n=1 Tax=Capilliphycus salinus TaxID=2768948 RepID=UPI0039A6C2B9